MRTLDCVAPSCGTAVGVAVMRIDVASSDGPAAGGTCVSWAHAAALSAVAATRMAVRFRILVVSPVGELNLDGAGHGDVVAHPVLPVECHVGDDAERSAVPERRSRQQNERSFRVGLVPDDLEADRP